MTARAATLPAADLADLFEGQVVIVTPLEFGALVAPDNGAIVYENNTMLYIVQPLYSDRDRDHMRRQMQRIADDKIQKG
jgi:hypothetical protein